MYDRRTKTYTGMGYKHVHKDRTCYNGKYLLNRWMDAEGITELEFTNTHKAYHPGFHIFLNKEDAMNYPSASGGEIWEVKYRNVISFGSNKCHKTNTDGPCVIAAQMKLSKRLGNLTISDGIRKIK